MQERQRIVLYGHSVVLGAVEASLRRHPDLQPISVSLFATPQELAALAPDVILFDFGSGLSASAIALLRECPDLLLVGVDSSSDDLLLLSTRPQRAVSVAELVQVIDKRAVGY